jgi:tRNA (cmo5U34)-methyltransferase
VKKDNIYRDPHQSVQQFRFDEHVSAVFSDMIHRSVPGYDLTLEMIGVIAREYGRADSQCYDLGCSLGASTLAIRHNLVGDNCRIIAVDNSPAMIEKCSRNVQQDSARVPVDVVLADVQAVEFDRAAISVMNFTLQFIDENERLPLLTRIAEATLPGGVLVLSEKIKHQDSLEQQVLTDLHHRFKSSRDYSDLEIAQKRTALEDVLVPDTLETHQTRLRAAGFSQAVIWFQCFTFASLIAIR